MDSLATAVLLGLAGLTACSAGAEPRTSSALTLRVEDFPNPTFDGATWPNLASQADRLGACWLQPKLTSTKLMVAEYVGGAWSDPVAAAEGADWFVNWADFPTVRVLEPNGFVVTWLQRLGEGTYAYGVRIRSGDTVGSDWLHADRSPTEHGFVSLASVGDRDTFAAWLDGREHAEHGMSLYATVVGRRGPGPEVQLDDRVCDCCQTDALALSDGMVLVAYRDRAANEVRDIRVARVRTSDDIGVEATSTVHADQWKIDGCPVNGPALARLGSDVAIAWYTHGADGVPRTRLAFSFDAGRSFEAPIEIADSSSFGRVDVVGLDEESVIVTWLGQRNGGAVWRARRVDRHGTLGPAIDIANVTGTRADGFLRAARWGAGVVVCWRDEVGGGVRFALLLS